jgi:hypothetical protein
MPDLHKAVAEETEVSSTKEKRNDMRRTAAIGLTASMTCLITSTALLHVSMVFIASSARRRVASNISVSLFADRVIVTSVADSVGCPTIPSTLPKMISSSACRMLSQTCKILRKRRTTLGLTYNLLPSNKVVLVDGGFRIKRNCNSGEWLYGAAGYLVLDRNKTMIFPHKAPTFSFHSTRCPMPRIDRVCNVLDPTVTVA